MGSPSGTSDIVIGGLHGVKPHKLRPLGIVDTAVVHRIPSDVIIVAASSRAPVTARRTPEVW